MEGGWNDRMPCFFNAVREEAYWFWVNFITVHIHYPA